MGFPVSELVLSELMEKFDVDHDGKITFEEFELVMRELDPKPQLDQNKNSVSFWNSLGEQLKKALNPSGVKRMLETAYPICDIDRIESLNVCYSPNTKMFAESSWADVTIAMYIKGREDPLIMVCSKPEHRAAWIDAFRVCIVNSVRFRSDSTVRKLCSHIGWQHQLIRASHFSLVVCNEVADLHKQVATLSSGISIDEQDEYHGYTALHYAVILDHSECAALLLRTGAKVNVKDNDRKTPLDHGKES